LRAIEHYNSVRKLTSARISKKCYALENAWKKVVQTCRFLSS